MAAHCEHDALFAEELNCPGGHGRQVALVPVPARTKPAGQVHASVLPEPVAMKPALQVHDAGPLADVEPLGQGEHASVAPEPLAK